METIYEESNDEGAIAPSVAPLGRDGKLWEGGAEEFLAFSWKNALSLESSSFLDIFISFMGVLKLRTSVMEFLNLRVWDNGSAKCSNITHV